MKNALTIALLTLILNACGASQQIRCFEKGCGNLTNEIAAQFEAAAMNYFGSQEWITAIDHYTVSSRPQDLETFCGQDLTCYTGESIVVPYTATTTALCLGIMTEYGQAYAFSQGHKYDHGHVLYPDYYDVFVPQFCIDY